MRPAASQSTAVSVLQVRLHVFFACGGARLLNTQATPATYDPPHRPPAVAAGRRALELPLRLRRALAGTAAPALRKKTTQAKVLAAPHPRI